MKPRQPNPGTVDGTGAAPSAATNELAALMHEIKSLAPNRLQQIA